MGTARFDPLNGAQGVSPPFESAELLRLAAILARGIIRAMAEPPDALTPGAIAPLFAYWPAVSRSLANPDVGAPINESCLNG